MSTRSLSLLRTVGSMGLGALAFACSESATQTPVAEAYNVIALVPLTGAFAGKGPEHLKAMQFAVSNIERAAVLDKPIRIIALDIPDNDTAIGSERVKEEIEKLRVDGTLHLTAIVSSTTAALKAAAPVALAQQIPHFEIASGSGLDEVTLKETDDRTYAFNPRPLCKPEPANTATFWVNKSVNPGWDKIFVMRGNQAHDKMHTREVRSSMLAKGKAAMILNEKDLEIPNTGPFEPGIEMAMAAGANVLYWHLNGDANNLAFIQAAERKGFTGKLVTCGMARSLGLIHPTDPGVAKYMSEGGDVAGEGRFYFAMRGPNVGPNLDAFSSEFSKFDASVIQPDTFASPAYDSIVLLGLGLAKTKANASPALRSAIAEASAGGTKYNNMQVDAALKAAAGGQDVDYDGASGPADMLVDPVFGNTTINRYYIETVVPDGAGAYKYKTLDTPIETL